MRDAHLEGLRCSFCNKDQGDVKKLISNPSQHRVRAYICDECIDICDDILRKSLDPKSSLLFGIEVARLKRMEEMDLITTPVIRKVVEAGGCTFVAFLEQLKQLLDIASMRLSHVERTEIGQQIQKLEQEVQVEGKTLEAKKTELEVLRERLSRLPETTKSS